jgi:signal transduction histidine kinase
MGENRESRSGEGGKHGSRLLPAQFGQVLENLVRNAVEHGTPDSPGEEDEPVGDTDSGLTVRVESLLDGFALEDDGVGFPVDRREALFGDATGTGEHTGLDLHIVEQVVEAHGWAITATESDAGGARIEITGVKFA